MTITRLEVHRGRRRCRAWEDLPTDVLKREQQCWTFDPKATWHGYAGFSDGYAMVDPNKLMLLTPGIDRKTGEYLDFGVPATVLANYLREQRIVPEKCDLNSILFLMTPAEDESKLNTLIAKLVKFKNLWDRDAPLGEALPTLYTQNSARYAGYSLRQVCKEMHDFYRTANVKELQKQCFRASSFPELAMTPKDAYEALVANEVDYLPLGEIRGRIAATLALIYPPGIGVIVPGERWDARAQPMLDYFFTFEESFNRFPGFNYEVQGVYQEHVNGRIKFYTYVRSGDRSCRDSGDSLEGEAVMQTEATEEDEPHAAHVHRRREHDGLGHHHAADQHGSGRRDLTALVDRDRSRIDGHRVRLRAGRHLQPAPRRHGGLCRGRLRQGRLFPGVLSVLPVARASATSRSRSRPSAISRRSSRACPRRRSQRASRVIALLWLTTVANFGGPSVTGRIGSVTVWGVIIPVGMISLIGWFWFSKDTFAAAWNPQGLSLGEGMGSSISLTLWAFLGMESAAQNSAAVENPKRNVPLACLFGTLGAAVIYVLSTTVIQGIVPNEELAASTGPFGLAYEHMFNPTIGRSSWRSPWSPASGRSSDGSSRSRRPASRRPRSACSRRSSRKVNSMGAPITGMIVLGVVQTRLALIDDLPDAQRAVQRARQSRRRHERHSRTSSRCRR